MQADDCSHDHIINTADTANTCFCTKRLGCIGLTGLHVQSEDAEMPPEIQLWCYISKMGSTG